MSDEAKSGVPALISELDITADMKLDKRDLITLMVSEQEEKLHEVEITLAKKVKLLQKEKKGLQKEHATHMKDATKGVLTDEMKQKVIDAMAAVGLVVSVKLKAGSISDSYIHYSINVLDERSRNYPLSSSGKVDIPKECKDLDEKIDILNERITELQIQRSEVKKQLSNMSSLERRGMAALVKESLMGHEKGQQLLDRLSGVSSVATAIPDSIIDAD
jgi:hypothetical protein